MYVCPICKSNLKRYDKVWHCKNGHSFDIAKKGYVNLLTTVKHNPKNAGDNIEMVKARTEFLDKKYYLPLANKTADVMSELIKNIKDPIIIDSGCGEGFYTEAYAKQIKTAHFYGIDISKNAISHCMTRIHLSNLHNADFAVSSSFKLPFRKGSADIIVCTFAPVSNDEYERVLKKDGNLIVVSPSPMHLFEFKKVLYENPYLNKPNIYGLNKFYKTDETIFEYKVELESNDDIMNLYSMTPYCYKTSIKASEKLGQLNHLELTCGFCIQTYHKK